LNLLLTSLFRRKYYLHPDGIDRTVLSAKATGDAQGRIFHIRVPVRIFHARLGERKTTHRTNLNTHIARDTSFFIKNRFRPRCRINRQGNVSRRIQHGLLGTNFSTDPTLNTGIRVDGMDFPFLSTDGLRRTFFSTDRTADTHFCNGIRHFYPPIRNSALHDSRNVQLL